MQLGLTAWWDAARNGKLYLHENKMTFYDGVKRKILHYVNVDAKQEIVPVLVEKEEEEITMPHVAQLQKWFWNLLLDHWGGIKAIKL